MWSVAINYWAVLVAGLSAMVIGAVWYSPAVLGKPWMKSIGKSAEEVNRDMRPVTLVWMYIVAFITAYILSHFIQLIGVNVLADALAVAFWAWLGFSLSVVINNALAEKRSSVAVLVAAGYQLVTLLVMAAILFSWK